jgi:hypothetical protein
MSTLRARPTCPENRTNRVLHTEQETACARKRRGITNSDQLRHVSILEDAFVWRRPGEKNTLPPHCGSNTETFE